VEAQSPFGDVRVEAVLQVLFHAGSLKDKLFEGGLHAVAPTHIPHKETLIHPPGDEYGIDDLCPLKACQREDGVCGYLSLQGGEERIPSLAPIPYTGDGVAQVGEHGILEVEAMLSPPDVLCLLGTP
jgi:hypothetical protein